MTTGDSRIKLLRHANVHYLHPDLEKADKFLTDFGLVAVEKTETKIYYRGYGPDPYCYVAEQSPSGEKAFGGGAFIVDSHAELLKASKLSGASSIQKCSEPGGGECVILKDPNDMVVKLIYGQTQVESTEHLPKSKYNTGQDKDRVGTFHRFKHGASKVHKVGHYGFMVPKDKFKETRAWYLDNLNFMLTDSVYDPKTGEDETSFCHIDLGETYVDHHVNCIPFVIDENIILINSTSQGVFFSSGIGVPDGPVQIHHSSFEVHDIDSQNIGHQWLQDRDWINAWGVGRHLFGSQIFDYWFDASGFILEHYADGDLVNCNSGYVREPAARNSLYVWGPNLPKAFVTARVEDVAKVPALESEFVAT